MPTDEKYLHSDLTNLLLQAYYKVYNTLGYGLDRQVYIHALYIECRKLGMEIEKDAQADVVYEGETVGRLPLDLLCRDKVLVKVTTNTKLEEEDLLRFYPTIKKSAAAVGLLLNFGHQPEHKRKHPAI
jgi:GxxExxY protein